jgi:hypothetical protein
MEEEVMEMGEMESMSEKYIPKQFDLDRLMSIEDETLRNMLFGLMTSNTSFREEATTTLKTYGLIIDQREGNINQLMND